MTDNEIKKALKEILELMLCEGDLQKSAIVSKAFYLINRLQAENIHLLEKIVKLEEECEWLQDTLETTKEIIDSLKLNKKREEI